MASVKIIVLSLTILCTKTFSHHTEDIPTEVVNLQRGESIVLECEAGVQNTDTIYWLSLRYHRIISTNEMYTYTDDLFSRENFHLVIEPELRRYSLHIRKVYENVTGTYQCVRRTSILVMSAVRTVSVQMLARLPNATATTTRPETPRESPSCSASLLPRVMNMINMNEREVQLTCSWSTIALPDATPELFCDRQRILSKVFVGGRTIARVALTDWSQCQNFTCKLRGTEGGMEYVVSCSTNVDSTNASTSDIDTRHSIRVEPMYTVIQQGMDAMFLCVASPDAPHGSFQWKVLSRLVDTTKIESDMHTTNYGGASVLFLRNVKLTTEEPYLIQCKYSNDSFSVTSDSLFSVIEAVEEIDDIIRFQPSAIVIALCATCIFLLIVVICIICCVCVSRNCPKSSTRDSKEDKSSAQKTRSVPRYLSMKRLVSRNRTSQEDGKVQVRGSLYQSSPSQTFDSTAQSPAAAHNQANTSSALEVEIVPGKLDMASTHFHTNISEVTIDDNHVVGAGASPVVVRRTGKLGEKASHYYSSTEVMVGSRDLCPDIRSKSLAKTDKFGYLIPTGSSVLCPDHGSETMAEIDKLVPHSNNPDLTEREYSYVENKINAMKRGMSKSCQEIHTYSYIT